MYESRTSALAIRIEPARAWALGFVQTLGIGFTRAGTLAVDTAQEFGTLLSALMAPAVFCTYAFAFWSLASNLGWTDSFPFGAGALSNWLVWLGISVLVHAAAHVLRKHTEVER